MLPGCPLRRHCKPKSCHTASRGNGFPIADFSIFLSSPMLWIPAKKTQHLPPKCNTSGQAAHSGSTLFWAPGPASSQPRPNADASRILERSLEAQQTASGLLATHAQQNLPPPGRTRVRAVCPSQLDYSAFWCWCTSICWRLRAEVLERQDASHLSHPPPSPRKNKSVGGAPRAWDIHGNRRRIEEVALPHATRQ